MLELKSVLLNHCFRLSDSFSYKENIQSFPPFFIYIIGLTYNQCYVSNDDEVFIVNYHNCFVMSVIIIITSRSSFTFINIKARDSCSSVCQ